MINDDKNPIFTFNSRGLKILVATTGLFSFASCKPPQETQASRTAFVIGENDIVPLTITSEKEVPKEIIEAAVLITTKLASGALKFCSGTLVTEDPASGKSRILTNHHCFASVSEDGKVSKEIIEEACTSTSVYFGFSALNEFKSFKTSCLKDSLRTDPVGDLAVFELEKNAPNNIQPLKLWPDDRPPENRGAIIVHHPNIEENLQVPAGEKTPVPAASITYKNCETQGIYPKTEWYLDPVLPYSFRHTCDLIHGSSGSALIDLETLQILGVNWGGMKVNYSTGTKVSNVSTKPGYARYFLDNLAKYDNPDAKGKAGKSNSASGAATIASGKHRQGGKKAEESDQNIAAGCGTISSAENDSDITSLTHLILLAIFLSPILLPVYFPLKSKKC